MSASTLINNNQMLILSVYLGDHTFGIPVVDIQDVLRTFYLTRVPLAPPYIAGVANLRGHIVTAINLNNRIFHENGDASNSMNVVIEHSNGELYSLLVDRVGDVLTLDKSNIEEPPLTLNDSLRNVSQGVSQLEKGIMVILDVNKVITHNVSQKGKEHEIVSYS